MGVARVVVARVEDRWRRGGSGECGVGVGSSVEHPHRICLEIEQKSLHTKLTLRRGIIPRHEKKAASACSGPTPSSAPRLRHTGFNPRPTRRSIIHAPH